jgi:hypothetical protein
MRGKRFENLGPDGGNGFEKRQSRGGKVLKKSSEKRPYVLRTDSRTDNPFTAMLDNT